MTKDQIITGYQKIISVINSCKNSNQLSVVHRWSDDFDNRVNTIKKKMSLDDQIDILAARQVYIDAALNKNQYFLDKNVNEYFYLLECAVNMCATKDELKQVYDKYIATQKDAVINEYIERHGLPDLMNLIWRIFMTKKVE